MGDWGEERREGAGGEAVEANTLLLLAYLSRILLTINLVRFKKHIPNFLLRGPYHICPLGFFDFYKTLGSYENLFAVFPLLFTVYIFPCLI